MAEPKKSQENSRLYKGTQELDHDYYKLQPTEMKKNVSYNNVPRFEHHQHGHSFHSIDSSGMVQDYSTPVGGHFHLMIKTKNPQGGPDLIECSKPMQFVRSKDEFGNFKKVAVEIKDDVHTHKVEYKFSEKIVARQLSAEFVKFEAAQKAKQPSSVNGIISK